MKIALLGCPFWGTIYGPNYTLALLAALVKEAGHEPVVFDLNIELYNRVSEEDKQTYWDYENHDAKYNRLDLLCDKYQSDMIEIFETIADGGFKAVAYSVTAFSSLMSIHMNTRIKARNPNLVSIFGGVNCFSKHSAGRYMEDPNIDLVCLGEAETVMGDLLGAIESGTWQSGLKGFLVRNPREIIDGGAPEARTNLDLNPYPDYSLFDTSKYTTQNKYTTQFSRGCINRCTFCYEHMIHKRFRHRSARSVIGELKEIIQRTGVSNLYINFADSLINGSIQELEAFCDTILAEGLSVTWWGQAAVRRQMTRDLLLKMKRAGCSGVSWGIETGSDAVLGLMNKNTNADLIRQVLRDGHEVGLLQNTNFIVGFPGERDGDFLQTCAFLVENLPYLDTIGTTLLSIEKNAPLYQGHKTYGIKDRDASIDWESTDGLNTLERRKAKNAILKRLIGNKYLGGVKGDTTVTDPYLDPLYNRTYNALMPLLREGRIKPFDKVALYGCGEWGRRFRTTLEANGIRTFAYLDSNPVKWGTEQEGIPIRDPAEMTAAEAGCKILIASSSRRAITDRLISLGLVEGQDFFAFNEVS